MRESVIREPVISVEKVMREIEDDLRRERRARLLARGAPPEYRDADVFAAVEGVLRRAVEGRDHDAILLPELLADQEEWRLQTHLRFTSHRPVLGPVIIAFKRRVLLPVMRWLYEYSLENFDRQQRVNPIPFPSLHALPLQPPPLP